MPAPLERLIADGLLRVEGTTHRTTRRWQGAMARAARHLVESGERNEDLRVPITFALIEIYGADCPDAELVELIDAIGPIEAAELGARRSA